MLTTNQKGALAENAVIRECIKLGVPVCRPIDEQRYDLALDLGARFLRVQCKWAVRRRDVVDIHCRRCRRGPNGLIHERYAGVSLRLKPTKNNQAEGIRWARDYGFAAKLEELLGR